MGKLKVARSFPARTRGLLGVPPTGDLLLLVPCSDVHTFGMRYALDIAFVDRRGEVLKAYRNVEPGCRLRCRSARAVLERAARPGARWLSSGEFAGLKIKKVLEERKWL